MVNADVVNTRQACRKLGVFCEKVLDFCGFVAFKNAVNYNCRSKINGETVHLPLATSRGIAILLSNINAPFAN
jgi:hypothetical protein